MAAARGVGHCVGAADLTLHLLSDCVLCPVRVGSALQYAQAELYRCICCWALSVTLK